MIDQVTIDRILDAAQIVDVVSEVRHPAQTRSELCRSVPVPQRKDSVIQRLPCQRTLQVFQLR